MLMNVLSLVSNVIIFLSTAVSLIIFFTKGGEGNMKVKRTKCFVYFTVDSNILVSVAAAVLAVFNVLSLVKGGGFEAPLWSIVFKMVGTAAVALTFMVVVVMLAPNAKEGYFSLFTGTSFPMHFSTPVLAMLSFILFEAGTKLSYLTILLALIPTIIYAIVYFIMVIIVDKEKGGWDDFYGFNKGGKWYLISPVVIGMSALLAFLIILLHNLAS